MWLLDWINANIQTIIAVCSTGSFITLVGFIWSIIKNIKLSRQNNNNTKNLTDALANVNNTKERIENTNNCILELKTSIDTYNRNLVAIIDILCLVHSRSKDEDVRNGVSNIITNLKYGESVIIKELRDKISELEKLTITTEKNEIDSVEEVKEVEDISRG